MRMHGILLDTLGSSPVGKGVELKQMIVSSYNVLCLATNLLKKDGSFCIYIKRQVLPRIRWYYGKREG